MSKRSILIIAVLSSTPVVLAESPGDALDPAIIHREVPGDPYVGVPAWNRRTSPPTRAVRGGFTSVQVNVDALGQNVIGDAANEPSIAVDLTDSRSVAVGWRQFDTVTSNFRQAGWGYHRRRRRHLVDRYDRAGHLPLRPGARLRRRRQLLLQQPVGPRRQLPV